MDIECTPANFSRRFRTRELERLTHFDDGVVEATKLAKDYLVSRMAIDLGGMRDHTTVLIAHRAPGTISVLSEILVDVPYAWAHEAGTERIHRFTPPAAPLVAWAERHGLPGKVGYAIQATIARDGMKPHWTIRDALPEMRSILQAVMGGKTFSIAAAG